jgi:hypothetical protein
MLDGRGITVGFNQIQVSHSKKSMRKRIPSGAIRGNFWFGNIVFGTGDHGMCIFRRLENQV